jgi:Fic family protein
MIVGIYLLNNSIFIKYIWTKLLLCVKIAIIVKLAVKYMRHIHKIFYENNASDFEEIYIKRLNYDSAIRLGISIKPMSQPRIYELYYVPSSKMINLVGKLHKISNEFMGTFNELPQIARKQFINECLVEELYSTNELEGIKSSREEIAKSTKDVILNKNSKKRFESMIRSYYRLLNNDYEFPSSPQDIRKIYNDITNGEIDQQELPDGEIFRKEATYIMNKSVSGKVVHQGITPESEIVNTIEKLLHFMNKNDEVPNVIKVAVGHYYFGYIHPFYDGNGRTSRFMSSMYLSKDIGNIPSLSLSRGCNKFKKKYHEAFETTNSMRSKGEMNSFIENFLEITIDALKQMETELKEKSQLLGISLAKIKNDELMLGNMTKVHKDTMFVLAQNHFFDSGSGLAVKDLADILNKSEATIRKVVEKLRDLSLIEQRGEKPAYFSVSKSYFETA